MYENYEEGKKIFIIWDGGGVLVLRGWTFDFLLKYLPLYLDPMDPSLIPSLWVEGLFIEATSLV